MLSELTISRICLSNPYGKFEVLIIGAGPAVLTADRDMLDAGDAIATACGKISENIARAAEYKRFTNYCQVLLENTGLKEKDPEAWKRIRKGLKETGKAVLSNPLCEKGYRKYALYMTLCGTGLFMKVYEGKLART